jgi:N-acetylmuramoyl-L-alanine amidase
MLIELCLALTIYHEARGEPLEGQRAVAEVVLNRVAHSSFPDDVCGVVKDPYQFSYVSNGWAQIPDSDAGWATAVDVASEAITNFNDGRSYFGDKNMLWYHRSDITTKWSECLDKKMTIGEHTFFSDYKTVEVSLRPRPRPVSS